MSASSSGHGPHYGVYFDVWSDSKYSTGSTREGTLTDVLAAEDYFSLAGDAEVSIDISRQSTAWSLLRNEKVLNVVRYDRGMQNSSAREFRVKTITEGEDEEGKLFGQVRGEWVGRFDLGRGQHIERIEANGFVQPHFELYGVPSSAHLNDVILSPASSSPFKTGVPSYYSIGTVSSTAPVDMIYSFDNGLSATIELGTVANLEPHVTETATGYTVSLLTEIGSTFEKPYLKFGRNMVGVSREDTSEEIATRIYMKGAGDVGDEATIADNAFEVASTSSGGVLTMVDSLVLEADQYNAMGLYAEMPNGTVRQITDSATGNSLTVPGSTVTGGDRIRIRRNSSGAHLTYMEKPTASAVYGVISRTIERPDIPRIDNEAPNAFFSDWTSGLPDSWNVVGSVNVAQNTASLYRQFGTASVHLANALEGEGIYSDTITVHPSSKRPHYTTQIMVWVATGRIRVELWDVTSPASPAIYPRDVSNIKAVTSETGTWTMLGLAHGEDHDLLGTTTFEIRILADEDGTEAYVDAAQLTNTAGGADTFYDGRASNKLLLAANDELFLKALPLERIDVQSLDLKRLIEAGVLDTTKYGVEDFRMGGSVIFHAPDLGLESTQRIKAIRRNLYDEWDTELELETELERLTRELTQRRRRNLRKDTPEQVRRPSCPENLSAFFYDNVVVSWLKGAGTARTEIRWNDSASTDLETRWDAGTRLDVTDGEELIIDGGEVDAVFASAGLGNVELMAESVSKHGLYSRCWVTTDISFIGGKQQCPNYGPTDGLTEIFSTCSTGDPLSYSTYELVDLEGFGLSSGDTYSYSYEGKIEDCASTGAVNDLTDYEAYWRTSQIGASRSQVGHRVAGVGEFNTPIAAGNFAAWEAMQVWTRPTSTSGYTVTVSVGKDNADSHFTQTEHFEEVGFGGVRAFGRQGGGAPSADAKFRSFRLMKGRDIIVNLVGGANPGKVRLRRNAGEYPAHTVNTQTFSSGEANIGGQIRWPAHRIEFASAGGAGFDKIGEYEVSTGIWGGSEYNVSTSTASTWGHVVTQVTEGLIHRDGFQGVALGPGWTFSGTPVLSGGVLSLSGTNFAIYTGTNARQEMLAQCDVRYEDADANRPGVIVRAQGPGLSTAQCQSAVDMVYLDTSMTPLSTVSSSGVTGLSYQKLCVPSTIPASARYAKWVAKKKGPGDCRPFVKNVFANFGPTCCATPGLGAPLPGIPSQSSGLTGAQIALSTAGACGSTDAGFDVTVSWQYSTAISTGVSKTVGITYFEEIDPAATPGSFFPIHSTQGIAIDQDSTTAGNGVHTVHFGVGSNEMSTGGRGTGSTGDQQRQWYAFVQLTQFGLALGQATSNIATSPSAYSDCT